MPCLGAIWVQYISWARCWFAESWVTQRYWQYLYLYISYRRRGPTACQKSSRATIRQFKAGHRKQREHDARRRVRSIAICGFIIQIPGQRLSGAGTVECPWIPFPGRFTVVLRLREEQGESLFSMVWFRERAHRTFAQEYVVRYTLLLWTSTYARGLCIATLRQCSNKMIGNAIRYWEVAFLSSFLILLLASPVSSFLIVWLCLVFVCLSFLPFYLYKGSVLYKIFL